MLALRSFFYLLLTLPIKLLVKTKVLTDDALDTKNTDSKKPIFYIIRHRSASDLLTLQQACRKLNLPDPLSTIELNGQKFDRTLCLEKPSSMFPWRKISKTKAIEQGHKLLAVHNDNQELDAQVIPVNLNWGRSPTKEKNDANVGTLLADQESPTWLRKFFIVLFLGRHTLASFSQAISLRYMADKHGDGKVVARKFLRVARFHFHRQDIASSGPRLMHREQMFTALFANPAVKRVIADEIKNKKSSKEKVKKQARAIMDEIAGDYRNSIIRLGERILAWLWNRLYNGIEVHNAQTLRQLGQDGHEIIYVPCHRSHMDYLLLTYVIYHEGLATPRIAAGINLNFWPAGPIFRKAGAFFIRRSFRGNRLYSTIFREYLGLLFERGYSVKYYTEGGRSRTGRLLAPKTGMLAMTMQSLLRGIDRPLTLVPVYIGYEHVMEVKTYHKELSGSKKKNESIFGVLKAIKNLRNYGKGYVNFGEPININQYLDQSVPDWKEAIDPIDPQKPNWLTPTVNNLATKVMTHINQAPAVNGVALVALILHATENKALAQSELEAQVDFFLTMQRQAPYSSNTTVPDITGKQLVADVIALNKVTVNNDNLGSFISLTDSSILEMRYYRNNILHVYLLPSLVCRLLDRQAKVSQQQIIQQVQQLIGIIKTEFFLWQTPDDIEQQAIAALKVLEEQGMAKHSKADFWSLTDNTELHAQVRVMAECIDESIQRLAIITSLTNRLAPITKSALEEQVVAIAERLSVLNNINAPEFTDKKAQSALINAMKELDYIKANDQGLLIDTAELSELKTIVCNLVDIEVLQSIAR